MQERRKKLMKIKLAGTVLSLWLSSMLVPLAMAAEAEGGKATYGKLCVSCHGPDGKGNPAMTKVFGEKTLNVTTKEIGQKKDDELLKFITEGKGKMPASGKGLSKEEQKQLLEYVRSLAK
jgi:cytochrome c oxidase cbb3-type subunit 3